MNKQSKNNGNENGLPTALLYMGMFAVAGCIALFLFALFTSVFFWGWTLFCKWSVVSGALPSKGICLGLGVLIYLLMVGAVYAGFCKSGGRTEREAARRRQKETASMQQRETAHAQDKAVVPMPQNESIPTAQGEAQPPPSADTEEVATGDPAAATQDTADAAPQTPLRFDGVYVAEAYAGKMNDFATGELVDSRRRYFLRFYPNGHVFFMSQEFPITAPVNLMFTPEKVFVRLGQSDPEIGRRYALTGDNLRFWMENTGYEGTIDGFSLLLDCSIAPDPYGNGMGDTVFRRFEFVKTA